MNDQKNTGLIVGMVAIAVLIFGGLTWAILRVPADMGVSKGDEQDIAFTDTNDPSVGPADARVVVHLYSDFQCPACGSAEPGVAYAIQHYADRVRFVWKDFPLDQIHPHARLAANAARCAEDQGKFWPYHDLLYRQQSEWSTATDVPQKLASYAHESGLNEAAFASCLAARPEDHKVADDQAEGFRNHVDRTPTVFVNKRRLFGMSPKEWDEALTQALQAGSASSTR